MAGSLREVGGRLVERKRDDAQVCPRRRAASWLMAAPPAAKFATICAVTAGRIGRHPLRDHAVIAGEDQHFDAVEPRHRAPLPAGEPHDHVFQASEAARRLGEHGVAARGRLRPPAVSPAGRSRQAARRSAKDVKAGHCAIPASRVNRAFLSNDTKSVCAVKGSHAECRARHSGARTSAEPGIRRACRSPGFRVPASAGPGMTAKGVAMTDPGAASPPISS